MSVTIYSCDTCKREIELIENNNSITLVNNCIITQHCKGTLTKTGSRPNGVIGKPTTTVDGLEDFQQQARLVIHNQTLPSSSWLIDHDLDCNPIVYVYQSSKTTDNKNAYTQLSSDQYVLIIENQKSIKIQFADNTIGIVHVIARPNNNNPDPVVDTQQNIQVSANTILTIATPILTDDALVQTFNIAFTSPSTSRTSIVAVSFTAHKFDQSLALFNTPWRNTQLIVWNDRLFRVRSVRITDIINSNIIEDGSPFYFVDNPDAIILTSQSPFENEADVNDDVVYIPDIAQNTFSKNQIIDSEALVDVSLLIDYFPKLQITKTINDT